MGDSFGGKNKAGRELIYYVRDELRPPVENAYSNNHPLLKRELFENLESELSRRYFKIQDPIQFTSLNHAETIQDVFVGELFGMCTREEMINKQQTSTANDFERLSGVTLNDDLEARIVNEFLTVKSFQRSDASRVFHKELVRPVVWCRMVVRRLLVYFIEADRVDFSYLYRKPLGQGYKYVDIYNFLRDRLRAVWQDLTVQHATRHRASIDSFEVSFRFLLLSEEYLCNLKEFNSVQNGSLMSTCLDKLMSGYMDVLYYRKKSNDLYDSEFSKILVYDSPFQPEFWSYRILTSMSIKIKDTNDNRIIDIINAISPELIIHPLIKLSLGVHCSFRFVNIVRYFRYFRKCYGIVLSLIKDESNSSKSIADQNNNNFYISKENTDLEKYRQFGHALILICIIIKKYSNIIRLKYLNILLSSNMSKRQLMPLNRFIEIFGFYIESVESLKLFTERFDIKIFNKDDSNMHFFQDNNFKYIKSIQEIRNITTKFVVSFKDCINLSTMESLSILNSLSWPSELLASILEKVPRIDILDPILGKISKADFKIKTQRDNLNNNKNQITGSRPNQFSFTSLSSSNRDLINNNSKNNVSNTIIQNIKDIDINKAALAFQNTENLTNQNKRKGFFMQEEIHTSPLNFDNNNNLFINTISNLQNLNTNKRRSLTENNAPPVPNSTKIICDTQTQINPIHLQPDLSSFNNSQNLSTSIATNKRQHAEVDQGANYIQTCAVNGFELTESKESNEKKENDEENAQYNERDIINTGEISQEDNLNIGVQKSGQILEFGKELSVSVASGDHENVGVNISGFENQIIEDGLVGLSGWRRFRVFFNNYQNSENIQDSGIDYNLNKENDEMNDYEESYKRISLLFSKINLPETQSGINQWLNLSVSGILEQIKTDIISRVIKSLRFSFVFFYNQLINIEGVSRSHISQLNTFYTKLELILSNLTNRDFQDQITFQTNQLKTSQSYEFIFPWNTVMVKSELLSSNKGDQMIIDIYEVDFSHDNYFERLHSFKQPQIPIHVEMLSIWQNNSKTCLRSQLFSSEDFSLLEEKEKEDIKESENLTLERLIYEYLINNGDVVVWTLPFLIRSNENIDNIIGSASFDYSQDSPNNYMKKSMDFFAVEIISDQGKKRFITEFESCCKVLNIKKYPLEEVKNKIPILKTITLVFSFVTYIPKTNFVLANDNEVFHLRLKEAIMNLENNLEEIILREYLQDCQSLVISDGVIQTTDSNESALISSFSGISCNLKFKCIGIAPIEVLQDSTSKQDRISIYSPGLNSLINTKLNNKSFPNNLVVTNNNNEDFEIDSITFLSTMWIQNFYKELNTNDIFTSYNKELDQSVELYLFKKTFKRGFIDCFSLFTNGNIDWILVSGNCSYTEIKDIIIWIYDLYIHSLACFENNLFASNTTERYFSEIFQDLKDPYKIRDLSRGILKQYEKYIITISDSLINKNRRAALSINIPKVIWNVLFDHIKPINTLNYVISDSNLFEQCSNLVLTIQSLREDQEGIRNLDREQILDSSDLLSKMDKEIFSYKTLNYLNRLKFFGD